jgi:hypothetical protein
MKSKTQSTGLVAVISLLLFGGISNAAHSQTVEEIAAKHLEAVGGAERIRAINSVKIESIVVGEAVQGSVARTVYTKRPNKIRVEYSYPQALIIMAYNGGFGWAQAILPSGLRKTPSTLSVEKTRNLLKEGDEGFDDRLLGFKHEGQNITLAGRSRSMGRDVYVIELMSSDGLKESRFIDVENFLEIERRVTDIRAISVTESVFSDFRTNDGVTAPYCIKVTLDGKSQLTTNILAESINYPMDDVLFEMPK